MLNKLVIKLLLVFLNMTNDHVKRVSYHGIVRESTASFIELAD